MKEVISTTALTKIYGTLRAVDNLNLSIKEGGIFGFLGLNGAGKTTTIRMLLGLVKPSFGASYLRGKKISTNSSTDIWHQVGFVVETPYSYPELTVFENLDLIRRLRGIKDKNRINQISKVLRLEQYAAKKAGQLSRGNIQRLGLAKALLHQPNILLLDEPTTGLDPAGIIEIRRLLISLADKHRVTILISSHKLAEIAKIATNIGIIHHGRLIKTIGRTDLKKQLKKSLLVEGRDRKALKSILTRAGYEIYSPTTKSGPLQIRDKNAVAAPEKIATLLVNAGHPPTLLKVQQEDLETFFLRSIQKAEQEREIADV